MNKERIKSKVFFQSFFAFILFFLVVTFMLGYGVHYDDGEPQSGFLVAYIITSAFCILYLGVKIGQKYVDYEEINEKTHYFLDKEKITIQEFREKYKDIIAIYDKSIRLFDDIKTEENKKPFNKILSDQKIINFLYYIASQNEEEEYNIFFKELKKGRPLEELFKKNNADNSEYFLLVREYLDGYYDIEFGNRSYLDDFNDGTIHFGGNSKTWRVTFDKNDSVTCEDEVEVNYFD